MRDERAMHEGIACHAQHDVKFDDDKVNYGVEYSSYNEHVAHFMSEGMNGVTEGGPQPSAC